MTSIIPFPDRSRWCNEVTFSTSEKSNRLKSFPLKMSLDSRKLLSKPRIGIRRNKLWPKSISSTWGSNENVELLNSLSWLNPRSNCSRRDNPVGKEKVLKWILINNVKIMKWETTCCSFEQRPPRVFVHTPNPETPIQPSWVLYWPS